MNAQTIKSFLKKLGLQFKLFAKECLPLAIVLSLCIEGFSRESFVKPFIYLFTSPLVFCYNLLLICATLSICFFFKRRRFVLFVISALWLAAGITDFIMLQYRTTPFTAVDLLLLDSAFTIMNRYFNPLQVAFVILIIILAIVAAVVLFFRAKKATRGTSPLFAGLVCGLFILTSVFSTKLFVSVGILERNFGNIAQAFHNNGLPYCFFASIFGTGISKPDSYSKEEIDRIVSSITITPDAGTVPGSTTPPDPTLSPGQPGNDVASRPNFVFLQLESFFDPTYIEGSEYSTDPVPTFRHLKETCSSGFLTVPSVGAGTANTEFEILSGMNLDFFGPGEYPYKTILKESTCESIAYNLSNLDYSAHAIHNNNATFYSRHKVFSQLGFDTFTSIEYMGSYETTPLGWAKDKVLIQQILNALDSTEGQDFVYTISVQAHGAYPDEKLLKNPAVNVLSLPKELEDSHYGILYFVNQLHEVDAFLAELLTTLEAYEEEIVLVMYGDHLPTFPFEDDILENDSIYETEYIIWNNRRNTVFEDRDVEAYALAAHVLDCYDIHEGLFTRFHQTQSDSDTYLEDMELLEYDALYGPANSYGGSLPFVATDLRFGTQDIIVESIFTQQHDDDDPSLVYVSGKAFTPYSVVYINGEEYNTTFINSELLSVSGLELSDAVSISIAQVSSTSRVLSITDPVTISDVMNSVYY